MKIHPRKQRAASGFLLLEMVLALAVFASAATGFVVAMNRMGNLAALAQSEMRAAMILDSALDEAFSLPTLEEGEETAEHGDITTTTTISLLEDLENEDGQLLQEMYHIEVTCQWFENGETQERSADTWRYGRMYQP